MIRQISIDELGRLEAVALEFYGSSEFLEDFNIGRFSEFWRPMIWRGAGVIFIEERNGEITGTIGGIVHREIYGEALVAVEAFWFVRKGFRANGIALYRRLEAWSREKKAASLHMMHLLDLMPEKVSRFYGRAGFDAIETRYMKVLA